ncbi:DMT family transporter [Paenibacillus chartarius]|uniref:DMT family transporter n=1 Tax=Paenibacillus chartarius TaxID=747481 RepID=A0ABV6DF76_9BACL
MNNWVLLLASCAAEILWVMGLKLSNGFTHPVYSILTGLCIALSFWLFAKTLKRFSISTGYALYTGIGTVGTTIAGALWLGEALTWSRVLFLALLLFGIIGLKMQSERNEAEVTAQGGDV